MRNILEKAFTIGLVMSLAKPHKAKQQVTKTKAKRYFFSTTLFIFNGLLLTKDYTDFTDLNSKNVRMQTSFKFLVGYSFNPLNL